MDQAVSAAYPFKPESTRAYIAARTGVSMDAFVPDAPAVEPKAEEVGDWNALRSKAGRRKGSA